MRRLKFKVTLGMVASIALLFSSVDLSFALVDTTVSNNEFPRNQRDKYSTDIFTGTANYSYTFKVPKGTNDLTPQVSFNYNSAAYRDLKTYSGLGWVLNQDYIERDVNGTPSNTSDDKFRLHFKGAVQDLIYVSSEDAYHTKIESYYKIKQVTGGNNDKGPYWLLTTLDGMKYRFGYGTSSELVCEGNTDYVLSWSLDLVTDTNDNKIDYTYSDTNGVPYLTEIKYNNDQTRKVEFNYATNDFEHPGYNQACYSYDKKMLINIQIKNGTSLVREYDIVYTTASDNMQPKLTSILEKGSDRSNYLTTSFDYYPITKGWNTPYSAWLNTDLNTRPSHNNGGC